MIYQVYHRYGGIYFEEQDTIEDAIAYNQAGECYGQLSSNGVIDTESKTVYLPEIGGVLVESLARIAELALREMQINLTGYEIKSYPCMGA